MLHADSLTWVTDHHIYIAISNHLQWQTVHTSLSSYYAVVVLVIVWHPAATADNVVPGPATLVEVLDVQIVVACVDPPAN